MAIPHPHAVILEAYAKDTSVSVEYQHPQTRNWLTSSVHEVLAHPDAVYRLRPQTLHICGYTTPAPTEQGAFEVFMRLTTKDGYVDTAVYKHIHLIDATAHFNLLKRASTPV